MIVIMDFFLERFKARPRLVFQVKLMNTVTNGAML